MILYTLLESVTDVQGVKNIFQSLLRHMIYSIILPQVDDALHPFLGSMADVQGGKNIFYSLLMHMIYSTILPQVGDALHPCRINCWCAWG